MAGTTKGFRSQFATDETDDCSRNDDERKRNIERKNGEKRSSCNSPMPAALQRPRTHSVGCLCHKRRYSGLDAIENARNDRHVAVGHIQPGQSNDDEQRWQDKKNPCKNSAPCPVQQPPQIGCKLLSLWPGQQHAVVKGVEKSLLGNPSAAVYKLLMHECNLTCGTTKADESKLQPETQRF
ncbi:hypothetical protein SDC9_94045 [bioreactor metagenome]|uniref:Uncharacterized protein n=1 Tax=bioreactor metagenome TaxID=1076179 RepID=A0A645A335_9ZZZZ